MKKYAGIFVAVGFGLSTIMLYLSFRDIPIPDLINHIYSFDYFWIWPSMLLVLLSFALRAVRWQIILSSSFKLTFWQAYHPLMIGFMVNCIFPGRVGEIVRPAIAKTKEGVHFSTGLATVAAERIFDLVFLLVLLSAVFMSVRIDPNFEIIFNGFKLNKETLASIGMEVALMSLSLIAGIILVSFGKTRTFINQVILKIPNLFFFLTVQLKEKILKRICFPLTVFIENSSLGFGLLKDPTKILFCSVLSLIIWCLTVYSHYLVVLGFPGIKLSLIEVAGVMVMICIFISLPSVPGYWGLWEAAGIFALSLFGISRREAAGYTLVNHAIQIFPIIIAGFISAIITGVNIRKIVRV